MANHSHPMREACEQDVRHAIVQHGRDFNKGPLAQSYVDQGVGRTTVYRWIEAVLASGSAAEPAGNRPPPRRTRSPARRPLVSPAASPTGTPVPVETSGPMPRVPRVEDVDAVGLIPVLEQINDCIAVAERVRFYAMGDGGTRPMNTRLALDANEKHRRCLETAAKINESVGAVREMERFHRALLSSVEDLAREEPRIAEKLIAKFREVMAAWRS